MYCATLDICAKDDCLCVLLSQNLIKTCYERELTQKAPFYTVTPRWLSVMDDVAEAKVSGAPPGDRAWTEAKMKIFAEHRRRERDGATMAVNPTTLLPTVDDYTYDERWRDGEEDRTPLVALESALWGPLDRGSYQLKYWKTNEPSWRPVYLKAGPAGVRVGFENDSTRRESVELAMRMGHPGRTITFTLLMPIAGEHEAAEVVVEMPSGHRPLWLVISEYRNHQMQRRMRFFRTPERGHWVEVVEFGKL